MLTRCGNIYFIFTHLEIDTTWSSEARRQLCALRHWSWSITMKQLSLSPPLTQARLTPSRLSIMHVKYGRTTIRTLCSSEKSSWQTVEEPLKSHTQPQTCSCQKHIKMMAMITISGGTCFPLFVRLSWLWIYVWIVFWWFLRRNSSPDVSLTLLSWPDCFSGLRARRGAVGWVWCMLLIAPSLG